MSQDTNGKHTPGKWFAVIESDPPKRAFAIKAAGGRCVARYLAYDDHRRFEHECALPEEVEANARLISTAPLGLDLARAVVRLDDVDGEVDAQAWANEWGAITKQAKALLAAERGA